MPDNIQTDGIPEMITPDMLREVLKAMEACYELMEGVQSINTAHLDGYYRGATDAMFDIVKFIAAESTRAAQSEAQRLSEKYDESRAVSTVEGEPSDDDLNIALKGLAGVIKRALFIGEEPEKTIGELWIEYGQTISPEMAARIRATLDTCEITFTRKLRRAQPDELG